MGDLIKLSLKKNKWTKLQFSHENQFAGYLSGKHKKICKRKPVSWMYLLLGKQQQQNQTHKKPPKKQKNTKKPPKLYQLINRQNQM